MKLTKARSRALEVLAERHRRGRCGRVSNVTDDEDGSVYWQSAAWLVEQGLAEGIPGGPGGKPSSVYLRVTPTGLEKLKESGNR